MEVYLTVDEDNIDDLTELGFEVGLGERIACEVDYTEYPADPDVGIQYPSADITHVYAYNDGNELQDMENFFCLDQLQEQAENEMASREVEKSLAQRWR